MDHLSYADFRRLLSQDHRHPESDALKPYRDAAFAGTLNWDAVRAGTSLSDMAFLLENMARHCTTTGEIGIILDLFDSLPRNRGESWITARAGEALIDRVERPDLYGALPEHWEDTVPRHVRGPSSAFWGKSMLRALLVQQGKSIGGLLEPEDRSRVVRSEAVLG